MRRATFSTAWCWCLFLCAATQWPSQAEEAASRRPVFIWNSASAAPSSSEALDAARQRLQSSIPSLKQFLATGGIQKETLWSKWLALSELESQIAAREPDAAILREHLDRLHSDRSGLELPHFVAV